MHTTPSQDRIPSPLAVALLVAFGTTLIPVINATAAEANGALLSSRVLDAETGEPISKFIAVAGVSPIEGLGWQWQPHMAQEFSDGQLQWPPAGKAGYKEQVLRIEAEGYVPYQTPKISRLPNGDAQIADDMEGSSGNEAPRNIATREGESVSLEIRLRRDAGISGRVLSETGVPIAGADVAVAMANDQTVYLRDGKLGFSKRPAGRRWPKTYRLTKTDETGRFKLATEIQTAAVVVAHELGVAVLSYDEFKVSPEIKLQPWGRIEGHVLWGDMPGSGDKVSLIAHGGKPTKAFQPTFMVNHFQDKEADENGRFVFEHVPPGPAQLSCHQPTQFVDVLPDAPTHVVLGGRGRPVIGKLVGRDEWEDVRIRIAPNAPRPGDMGTEHDPWPSYLQFLSSKAGENYVKNDIRVESDGRFRIENVPPEYYQLFVSAQTEGGKSEHVGGTKFSVSTIPGGESDEPLDIGEVRAGPKRQAKD